jgi:hypothetical protein
VDRSDDFVIREYSIDVRHPRGAQIFGLCCDQRVSPKLRCRRRVWITPTASGLFCSYGRACTQVVHKYATSFQTKTLLPQLQSLLLYDSIVSYSIRVSAALFSPHHGCTGSLYSPPILRRKVASPLEGSICGQPPAGW